MHPRGRPVLSVTSDVAIASAYQAAAPKLAMRDPVPPAGSFETLVANSLSANQPSAPPPPVEPSPAARRAPEPPLSSSPSGSARENSAAPQSPANATDNPSGNSTPSADANADDGPRPRDGEAGTLQSGAKGTGSKPADTRSNDKNATTDDPTGDQSSTQTDGASATTLIAASTAIAVGQQPAPVNTATAASSDSNAPLAITAVAIASTSTQAGLSAQLAPTSTQSAGPDPTLAATDAAKATVEKAAGQATTETTPAQPQLVPTDLAATGAELIAATANATTTKVSTTGFKAVGATLQSKAPAGTSATGTSDAGGGSATATTAAQAPSVQQSHVAAAADSPTAPIDPLISNGGNGPPSLTPSAAIHNRASISPDTQAATIPTDATAQGSTAVLPALTVAPQIVPTDGLTAAPATGALVPLGGLAVEIAASAQSGKTRFELRLEPADLGRIDVRIDVDRNGQVTSHLTVEKAETLAILQQDAPQLQQALNDAGLKTGSGGLQFSLRDQSSYGSGQNGNNNSTSGNARQLVISEDETMQAALAGQLYGRMSGASAGVDIRV